MSKLGSQLRTKMSYNAQDQEVLLLRNKMFFKTLLGGPGKRKLSEEDKIFRILSRLPHESLMKDHVPGYNKNEIMEKILSSRSVGDKPITALLKRFEDSGIITKRKSERHERGTFYYYTTDKGIHTLETIIKLRGLLPPVDDFE